MGEIHRAGDTKLGREIALKVLPPEMSCVPESPASSAKTGPLRTSMRDQLGKWWQPEMVEQMLSDLRGAGWMEDSGA